MTQWLDGKRALVVGGGSGIGRAVVDAFRIRGDLRIIAGQIAEGQADLREAIARGQKIGAKVLELRAATSLARFFQMRGAHAIAQYLLAATYGLFTEGFDTADLKDAKALLEELGGSPGTSS